jgi:DNA polymerase III alpha subunit
MDGFQLVATNNCRYPRQEQGQYYEYLLLMQNGVKASDARRREIPEDYFFKTRLEMFDSFREQSFDPILINSWLDRTVTIADKIEPLEFKIDFKLPKFNTDSVDIVVPSGGIITGFTTEGEEDDDDDVIDAEFSVQMELANTKD